MKLPLHRLNFLMKALFLRRRFLRDELPEGMRQRITLCFAVTACDEAEDLDRLLSLLTAKKEAGDEILLQVDGSHATKEVRQIAEKHAKNIDKYIEFSLDDNFGAFKNNMLRHTQCDYIFQIDADELPSDFLLKHLHALVESNPKVDLFRVPRINLMIKDEEPMITWGNIDGIDEKEYVNYPDYQYRIFRHRNDIRWVHRLHEIVKGYKTMSYLPAEKEYCMLHCKHWTKQNQRSEFYGYIKHKGNE